MRKIILIIVLSSIYSSIASGIPSMQLYIDGANYDWETETWIIENQPFFDLYLVACIPWDQTSLENVKLVISNNGDFQAPASILIDGVQYPIDEWLYGSPPFPPANPPHGVFPAWYFIFETGDFHAVGGLGDIIPDGTGNFYNPVYGYLPDSNHLGQIKIFEIEVPASITNLHFDACMIDNDSVTHYAPFSHDAGYIAHLVGLFDETDIPNKVLISCPYPNPFNAQTSIWYSLPIQTNVCIAIYNLLGRKVETIFEGEKPAGEHQIIWDAKS